MRTSDPVQKYWCSSTLRLWLYYCWIISNINSNNTGDRQRQDSCLLDEAPVSPEHIRMLLFRNNMMNKTSSVCIRNIEVRSRNYCCQNKPYVFWVCVCSCRLPACNAHAPYCHLWPVRLYNIFPHYLINLARISKKKRVTEQNKCSDFLYNFCLKTFHSKKNWARYDLKCIWVFI